MFRFLQVAVLLLSAVLLHAQPKPFKISISQDKLDDLGKRLQGGRFPSEPARIGIKNELGIELSEMKVLFEYWKSKFDWKSVEDQLNLFPQFHLSIHGADLHFIHVKAKEQYRTKNVLPILLVHGWPSTSFDFAKLIPRLSDPEKYALDHDAFDVIVPTIPGFPFSEPPRTAKYGTAKVAACYSELMRELGYSKYIAHGGDWGSIIIPELAVLEESLGEDNRLIGIHINGVVAPPPISMWKPLTTIKTMLSLLFPALFFDEYDRIKLKSLLKGGYEFGYFLEQVTKPATIGTVLHNSPLSLAVWLTEKYITWTDSARVPGGGAGGEDTTTSQKSDLSLHTLDGSFSLDEILTTVSLYWFTDSITSSVMMYHNSVDPATAGQKLLELRVRTPCGVADFPVDILWAPRAWAKETFLNIIQFNRIPRGGHFAALEQPQLLAEQLFLFKDKVAAIEAQKEPKPMKAGAGEPSEL